jgi:Transketolase, pyrimidine binding domain
VIWWSKHKFCEQWPAFKETSVSFSFFFFLFQTISFFLLISAIFFLHRVKPEVLKRVGQAITTLPDNFKPHRAVKKIFEQRAQMIESGEGIDWAVAEALAFATLIVEGNHVRLSGQDVERGTFSHRHAVLHDQESGEKYCPLDHVVMNQHEELFTVSNRYVLFAIIKIHFDLAG